MKNYYVYIMANATNVAIYTGVTNNLPRRVYQHKHSMDPNSFTSRYKIYKLVYYEVANNSDAAIAREKQIKGMSRAKKNALVNSMNPKWEELYDSIL